MNDIITFLRNYDYDICLARGDFWTLEEAVDYLAAYKANRQNWHSRESAYSGFLSIREQLLEAVQHAVNEGDLAIEEVNNLSCNGEADLNDSEINIKKTTVIIVNFISWALENNIDVPPQYEKYAARHKEPKGRYYEKFGVKKSTIHHERCRAIAEMLWSTDPGIAIAEMARRPEIIQFGCEGQSYDVRTISRWLASLKADRRPGRRKQEATS